jgi:hypothetical protein
VCALDAAQASGSALARLASSFEYNLGSSIQQSDRYSTFTDLMTNSRINGCASAEYRVADDVAKSASTGEGYADLRDLTVVCDISVSGGDSTGIDTGQASGALIAALVAEMVVALA